MLFAKLGPVDFHKMLYPDSLQKAWWSINTAALNFNEKYGFTAISFMLDHINKQNPYNDISAIYIYIN